SRSTARNDGSNIIGRASVHHNHIQRLLAPLQRFLVGREEDIDVIALDRPAAILDFHAAAGVAGDDDLGPKMQARVGGDELAIVGWPETITTPMPNVKTIATATAPSWVSLRTFVIVLTSVCIRFRCLVTCDASQECVETTPAKRGREIFCQVRPQPGSICSDF